jgi:YVTN family beta-propeller protein
MSLPANKAHYGCLICLWSLLAMPLTASTGLIVSANWVSGTVDVINARSNKVVESYKVELPHAADISPDGKRVYASNEDEEVLDVLDRKSGKIVKKIPLSGHPNNIAVTQDGGRVLVCIRNNPGAVDIVDTASLTLKKSIPVKGGLHNDWITPDGKYVVAGSIWGSALNVIDLQTEELAWVVKFEKGVRPMTADANPDGSTRRIYLQLTGYHGFVVVDFATHKEVARIDLPDEPKWYQAGGSASRGSHGIGVAPDNKTLWVVSAGQRCVFAYSLPDLKLLGYARTGWAPHWLTITPDSAVVYVANEYENTLSAIDAKTFKEVARIPVHDDPKRINTAVLPR